MPSVALIHSGKSFLPEISAYQHFFQQIGIQSMPLLNPAQSEMEPHDILWFFMGIQKPLQKTNKKKIIVHEFCSASTPPLAALKNLIKKVINPKPDLRISLAAEHGGTVFPIDDIPLIIRKQGVHQCFFEKITREKEYDFIYTGSALRIRKTDKWLRAFVQKFPDARFILVGNHEPGIVNQFKSNPNIYFKSSVIVTSLPALLASARYAINYVPDIYPFNVQPSTKLLEYNAAGCNIISNSYGWANQFSSMMKAGIYFIDDHFDNLSSRNLEQFHFSTPDMQIYRWEAIFEEMQIQKYLFKRKRPAARFRSIRF